MPRLHRAMTAAARSLAVLGGVVLTVAILITCLSILGRTATAVLHSEAMRAALPGLSDWLLATGIGPIRGSFELVEAAMAFCIFAFLPYCQVTSGHATVDVFTSFLRPQRQRVLSALIEVLFAVVLVVIALQLKDGMDSRIRSGQTSFLLQFPVWWAYAASLLGATAAALAGVYMAAVRIAEALIGRPLVAAEAGAGH